MSFQQRTIGEICSELLAEAVRMGYSKRYVWGHMSKYLSIIRGYYRNHHICIFSVEATDACLASYRIEYGQGTVTRVRNYFINKKAMARKLEIPYRSLLRVFNEYSYPGDIQRTMNAIATYCMEQCM